MTYAIARIGQSERLIYSGEIEDSAEIMSFTFPVAQAKVECDITSLVAMIAIIYPQKTAYGTDRDDYAALVKLLIQRIICVINIVNAAVV